MEDKIVILVTCADAAEAERVALALLERRWVACASIGAPVRSLYPWKGERAESAEVPLLLKTRATRFDDVAAEIQRLHSYEVPEILALPVVAGSAAYLGWMDEVLA